MDGTRCRAPLKNSTFCYWHEPVNEEDAAEARRLGGLRRRREKVVASAYDYAGLESIPAIRRILQIAIVDTLGQDNSAARSRTLIHACQVATKQLEVGELAARVEALELQAERSTRQSRWRP